MLTLPFGKVSGQCTPLGDTSVYGNHVWNVYAFNAGDESDNGQSWRNNYSGYYVDSTLNFNTQTKWPDWASPSYAPDYTGCAVNADYHSWSARRRGFDCGIYQVDILNHDNEGQLFVNGVKVWEHNGCCDQHINVWTGALDDTSAVVFRVTEGFSASNGALRFTLKDGIIPLGPTTICPGYTLQLDAGAADTYLWSTGETTRTIGVSAAGNYSVTATGSNCVRNGSVQISIAAIDTPVISSFLNFAYCPYGTSYVVIDNYNSLLNYTGNSSALSFSYEEITVNEPGSFIVTSSDAIGCSASAHFTLTAPAGESDFGNGVWKVNAYANGDGADNGYSWRPNDYSGYYIDTTLNFDSRNRWNENFSPYVAVGYQGCGIPNNQMSWSAKRKGFSCGTYQVDVLRHDDQAQLFIDGVKVWDETGYTTNPFLNAWTGTLTPSSEIEFRVTDGTGTSNGELNFTLLGGASSTIAISGNQFVCTGQFYTLTGFPGTSYQWSDGEMVNPIHASQSGDYWVNVVDTDGCMRSSDTVSIAILPDAAPMGQIAASSNTICIGDYVTLSSPSGDGNMWSTNDNTQSITVTSAGNYTLTVTNAAGCVDQSMVTITASVLSGDTSVYGDHVWNVYAFNASYWWTGEAWRDNYSGYYIDSNLNFDTQSRWPFDQSPSAATGYSGCAVAVDNHSWSAKRKGFPCGIYQINIPVHDDAAQLFVNGTLVWSDMGCCDSHDNVWSGLLTDSSAVVFRCTELGWYSYGRIEFVLTNRVISVEGPTTICPGYTQELNGIGGGTYLWSTGETTRTISVNTAGNYLLNFQDDGCMFNDSIQINIGALDTPVIALSNAMNTCPPFYNDVHLSNYDPSLNYYWNSPNASFNQGSCGLYAPGDFILTAVDGLGCAAASAQISIAGPPGVESESGNGVWKVNGYWTGSGYNWRPLDYMGYYVDSTLNFDSQNKWDKMSNPSTAPDYQGCSMYDDGMSWSAKRRGFPCGIYSIDVLNHDDQAQLFVDGIEVWEEFGYTDSTYSNAWTGPLNSSSTVEFRVTEGNGASDGALNFTLLGGNTSLITVSGDQFVCTGQSYLLTSVTGASYLWSNGETTNPVHVSQSGSYSVIVTDDAGCTLTSDPANITILSAIAPVAHISASASIICDWNAVTLTSDSASGNTWNTSATTQTINTNLGGNYTLTVTNAAGCSDQSTVNIGIGFTPPAPLVENSGPVCEGQPVNLKATGLAPGGQAASFNGVAQYIEVTQQFPQNNFTIEMWVKTNDPNAGIFSRVYFDWYHYLEHNVAIYLINGQLYFGLGYYGQNTGFTIADGKWHHIAAIVQSGVGQIAYVDGSPSGILDANDYFDNYPPFFRIGDSGSQGRHFNGQIDNIRIWDEARSQGDIRNNMMLESPVSSEHLVYHSTLNGNLKASEGSNGHAIYGISYVDPDFYTYSWTGTGAPAPSTDETQTTTALSATETYSVTATAGCSPSSAASTLVTVNPILNYYPDADSDGYGSSTAVAISSCTNPGSGYVTNNSDCDEGNPGINPNATEICSNGIDDNCNGQTDENCGTHTYYADSDGDTFGNPAISISSTSDTPPSGYASNSADCNDSNAAINPNATEVCNNGIDDNCNGQIDENCPTYIYYTDNDEDSYGNPAVSISSGSSTPPAGYVSNNTDCNDGNNAIHPGSAEVCNSLDDNCNGQIDEGVTITFYADADADGYGNANSTTQACSILNGYVSNSTDCNDDPASGGTINPSATETCGNGADDNCNGQMDENCPIYTYYADADGDTYGNPAVSISSASNTPPAGYVSNNTDCNDAPASGGTIHIGASDICNSIDDNCNGVVDENAISATISPGGSVSFCSGSVVNLIANTGTGISYQWMKGSKNVSGATYIAYTPNKAGSYKVKETNSFGCTSTSAATTLVQISKPAASITALGNLNICGTNSVVLQANAGTNLTYQWLKNTVTISGATNQTYNATAKGTYKCIVMNSTGCSTTSNALKVTKSCKEDLVDDLATASFNIYPNPSDGNFTVTADWNSNLNSEATVILYNALGQIVYTHKTKVTDGKLSLEIKSEASRVHGIYTLKVIAGGEQFTSRVVIQ